MNVARLHQTGPAQRRAMLRDTLLLRDTLTELLLGPGGGTSLFDLLGLRGMPPAPGLNGVGVTIGPQGRPALLFLAHTRSGALDEVALRLGAAGVEARVEIGVRFVAAARPAQGGTSIGSGTTVRSGTLGCAVASRADGHRFALTCNHVIADLNMATPASSEVWAPGVSKGGTGADCLGVVAAYAPIDFAPGAYNDVDAALAQPDHASHLDPAIARIGRPAGAATPPAFGDAMRKSGAMSGLTTGTYFYDINARIDYDDGSSALFRDMLGVGTSAHFAVQGDSGAVVVDGHDGVVGMIVSVAEGIDLTLACRIQPVLDHFQVDIVT